MEFAEARRVDTAFVTNVLLAAFVGTLALNWPTLPYNAQIADLIFPFVLIAFLLSRRLSLPRFHWLDGLVIAYIAGSLPSFLASDTTASGVEFGRIVYLALIYVVVAAVVAMGYLRLTIYSLAAGACVLAAIGVGFAIVRAVIPVDVTSLAESMTMPYAGEVVRLRALTASPAMLACVLTVAVPFALAALLRGAEISGQTASKPPGGSCPRTAPAVLGAKSAGGGERACAAAGAPRPRPPASEVLRLPRSTHLFVAALVIGCAAAFLTFSHAVVGLMTSMLIVQWPRLASRRTLRAAAVALVVIGALLANVTLVAAVRSVTLSGTPVAERGAFHHAVEARSLRLGDVRVDYEVMSYFRIKELAVDAFVSHPWTGIGLDRFHEVTSAAHQQGRLPATYREIDPHSTLLGRLAETGIVGGITLVALWVGFVLRASVLSQPSSEGDWVARASLAALAGLLITSINVDVMNFRFLWATFGIIRGLAGTADRLSAST